MTRRFINIRTLQELEQLTGRAVPVADRPAMRRVMERFPVRLTPHLLELCRRSPAVAAQFLPDPREDAEDQGQEFPFCGLHPTGVAGVERVYRDRCVIMPRPACPATCRFCFRKYYRRRGDTALSGAQLDKAAAYVARTPALREVLITGGEPLMDLPALDRLMAGLREMAGRLATIRVACRSLVTDPGRVDGEAIRTLRRHQDLPGGRPVEVAAHINHPDELSPPTVAALGALREQGVHVYNQAVLLRGVNDDEAVLLRLLRRLRRHGVETYALFYTDPVRGAGHMRPSLDRAMALRAALRGQLTGRALPHLVVTTRLGKVEPGIDGQVVEREPGGRWVWISLPYTMRDLRRVAPEFELPIDARLDANGRVEVRFLDGADASRDDEAVAAPGTACAP